MIGNCCVKSFAASLLARFPWATFFARCAGSFIYQLYRFVKRLVKLRFNGRQDFGSDVFVMRVRCDVFVM
ncbi:MAG: hypothetical protein AAB401_16560, partial [Acidobacteriota bacterium]